MFSSQHPSDEDFFHLNGTNPGENNSNGIPTLNEEVKFEINCPYFFGNMTTETGHSNDSCDDGVPVETETNFFNLFPNQTSNGATNFVRLAIHNQDDDGDPIETETNLLNFFANMTSPGAENLIRLTTNGPLPPLFNFKQEKPTINSTSIDEIPEEDCNDSIIKKCKEEETDESYNLLNSLDTTLSIPRKNRGKRRRKSRFARRRVKCIKREVQVPDEMPSTSTSQAGEEKPTRKTYLRNFPKELGDLSAPYDFWQFNSNYRVTRRRYANSKAQNFCTPTEIEGGIKMEKNDLLTPNSMMAEIPFIDVNAISNHKEIKIEREENVDKLKGAKETVADDSRCFIVEVTTISSDEDVESTEDISLESITQLKGLFSYGDEQDYITAFKQQKSFSIIQNQNNFKKEIAYEKNPLNGEIINKINLNKLKTEIQHEGIVQDCQSVDYLNYENKNDGNIVFETPCLEDMISDSYDGFENIYTFDEKQPSYLLPPEGSVSCASNEEPRVAETIVPDLEVSDDIVGMNCVEPVVCEMYTNNENGPDTNDEETETMRDVHDKYRLVSATENNSEQPSRVPDFNGFDELASYTSFLKKCFFETINDRITTSQVLTYRGSEYLVKIDIRKLDVSDSEKEDSNEFINAKKELMVSPTEEEKILINGDIRKLDVSDSEKEDSNEFINAKKELMVFPTEEEKILINGDIRKLDVSDSEKEDSNEFINAKKELMVFPTEEEKILINGDVEEMDESLNFSQVQSDPLSLNKEASSEKLIPFYSERSQENSSKTDPEVEDNSQSQENSSKTDPKVEDNSESQENSSKTDPKVEDNSHLTRSCSGPDSPQPLTSSCSSSAPIGRQEFCDVGSQISKVVFKEQGFISCSGLPFEMKKNVMEFAKKINYQYTKDRLQQFDVLVTNRTENIQSIRYLMSLVSRSFIVDYSWIQDCEAHNTILNPEPYVIETREGGPKRCISTYPPPFEGCTIFTELVDKLATFQYIKHMCEVGGATVVESIDSIDSPSRNQSLPFPRFCIFKSSRNDLAPRQMSKLSRNMIVALSQEWVYDSILSYRKKPIMNYLGTHLFLESEVLLNEYKVPKELLEVEE